MTKKTNHIWLGLCPSCWSGGFDYWAGEDFINAVVVTSSAENAKTLLLSAREGLSLPGIEGWEWRDLGIAADQTERIEVLAYGAY